MPRLYHMPLSPFCRKVRLTLAEKKLEVDLIEEWVWEKRPDYLRYTPSGKVPSLRLNGIILSESNAICEYMEEVYPKPNLLPDDPIGRAEVRRLNLWFDDKFYNEVSKNLIHEKVNKKLSKSGNPESALIKVAIKNIKFHLDYMDWLLQKRDWLAGKDLTLADFSAAAHFSCLDHINDIDWSYSTSVKDWYAKIKSRPAFRSVLSDFLPGFSPPPHYTNLDF